MPVEAGAENPLRGADGKVTHASELAKGQPTPPVKTSVRNPGQGEQESGPKPNSFRTALECCRLAANIFRSLAALDIAAGARPSER